MIMSDDREAFVPHPEGRRNQPIVPVDLAAQARITELEGQLQRLLDLWTAQTSTVRVEPGQALLIGGVDTSGDNVDSVLQAIADLRKATGIPHVWLFAADIDVQAVELKEQKHAMGLERQLAAIGVLAQQHVDCDRDCGPLARGVRELLGAEPGRPAQPGTDISADAAFEDQTMPDSRPNTQN